MSVVCNIPGMWRQMNIFNLIVIKGVNHLDINNMFISRTWLTKHLINLCLKLDLSLVPKCWYFMVSFINDFYCSGCYIFYCLRMLSYIF